jgi:hypothetical protein
VSGERGHQNDHLGYTCSLESVRHTPRLPLVPTRRHVATMPKRYVETCLLTWEWPKWHHLALPH